MNLNLKGKTVIVTGGASNIGRAISIAFGIESANVIIGDIDPVQGEKVAQLAASSDGKSLCVKTDVTDYSSVQEMVKFALEKFGKIDVLINCAGWNMDRWFVEKPRDEWEKEINVNLWGVINCIRAVVEPMTQRKSGRIVSVSSDAGRIGEYKEAVYSACKGGIISLSKSLAKELGRDGINVNCVCPGLVVPAYSEMSEGSFWKGELKAMFTSEVQEKAAKLYPLRRLGTAQDVANMVVFLSSDAASYVTGQTISVSGGYTMV